MSELEKKNDIKELMELVEALRLVAMPVISMIKGKKFDLSALVKIAVEFEKLKDGWEGLSDLPSEIADIDEEEAALLVAKIFSIIREVRA